jgi:hypothetical protein
MKKSTLIIIVVTVVVILTIGGYFVNGYSQRSTLKTALNIGKLPHSLKILDYSDQGVSSFRAEFYLSVNGAQFDELIKGRKYEVRAASNNDLVQYATGKPGPSFVPVVLCKWATEKNRTIIYTNISKTLVYVIWDEN